MCFGERGTICLDREHAYKKFTDKQPICIAYHLVLLKNENLIPKRIHHVIPYLIPNLAKISLPFVPSLTEKSPVIAFHGYFLVRLCLYSQKYEDGAQH